MRKNILGSWGEMSFFFQGIGSKHPPGGPQDFVDYNCLLMTMWIAMWTFAVRVNY